VALTGWSAGAEVLGKSGMLMLRKEGAAGRWMRGRPQPPTATLRWRLPLLCLVAMVCTPSLSHCVACKLLLPASACMTLHGQAQDAHRAFQNGGWARAPSLHERQALVNRARRAQRMAPQRNAWQPRRTYREAPEGRERLQELPLRMPNAPRGTGNTG
jgi:hypothetical protein